MEKAERRALLGFVLTSWLALGVRAGFWYKSHRMYVTQEHPVPIVWLFESLETVRSSPSNRKRPSASQLPPDPEQQHQRRQQRVLDLNAADSAALEAMPYIGPVLAARICWFRHALGGFHAVEQLREVWGLKPEAAERLMPMFHTGTVVYQTLCADTATWFELKNHPYIDAKAASAIERYRRHHPLDSLEALADAIPITDSMIRRWSPYLGFVNTAINSYRSLEDALKTAIQDVPDFPQAGVVFKDLSPVWANPSLRAKAVNAVAEWIQSTGSTPTAIAGIESRGFLLGMSLADRLNVPFVALRKAGKLPGPTVSESYELEYGTAVLECQLGAFESSDEVLIHDDVLATGGTAAAAAALVNRSGAQLWGFSFLMSLNILNGSERLQANCPAARFHSLLSV